MSAHFLTQYDPLEPDPPEYGRQTLLVDLNEYILNGWKQPKRHHTPIKFDWNTWMSVVDLVGVFQCRKSSAYCEKDAECMFKSTLALCFSDDTWHQRAIHTTEKEYALANASK